MAKQLWKILLLTTVISFIAGLISTLIIYHPALNTHDGAQMILLFIVGALYINFLLVVCTLPIFLNIYEEVRQNLVLRALTFFVVPLFVLFYFTVFAQEIPLIIMSAVYLIVLFFFFIKFNKKFSTTIE